MKQAVIVDGVRTAIGRSHKDKGVFRDVRSDDLAVAVVKALVERTGIDPAESKMWCWATRSSRASKASTSPAAWRSWPGCRWRPAAATVNRLCGSSLQALNQATHAIMAGFEDVQIVGGLEHMQHIPMDKDIDLNPKMFQRTSKGALRWASRPNSWPKRRASRAKSRTPLPCAAISRRRRAQAAGEFKAEIVPVWGHDESGPAHRSRRGSVRAP